VYAFAGGIAAIITRHPLLIKSTRQAGIATCGLIFLATLSLEYLFFSDNFFPSPTLFRTAIGTSRHFIRSPRCGRDRKVRLLFWSFLLAVYVISVLLTYRNKNGELMPYVGVVMAACKFSS